MQGMFWPYLGSVDLAGGHYYNTIGYVPYAALFTSLTYFQSNFLTLGFILCMGWILVCRPFLRGRLCFFLFSFSDSPPLQFWGLFPSSPWSPQVFDWLFGAPAPQWCWAWAYQWLSWKPSGEAKACLPSKLVASQTLLWIIVVVSRLLSWPGMLNLGSGFKPPALGLLLFLFLLVGQVSCKLWSGRPYCLFPAAVLIGCDIHSGCCLCW